MWHFDNKEYEKKAIAEDMLIGLLFRRYERLAFHGGTCIWRCYGGNRFSRDVDLYYDLEGKDHTVFTKELLELLKSAGFAIKEKGYSPTDTLSIIVETSTKCKLDINFDYKPGAAIDYIMVDGSRMKVLGLSAKELMEEKIAAHTDKTSRGRSEIQEIYDIWTLMDKIEQPKGLGARLIALVNLTRKDPPKNEGSLNVLILSGVAPTLAQMLHEIEVFANDADKKNKG